MFDPITLLPYVLSLITGIVIGIVIIKFTHDDKKRIAVLEKQLHAAQKEIADYQEKVTQHFIHTAQLVNQLTDSYKAVHEHLAEGAQELSTGDPKLYLLQSTVIGHTTENTKERSAAERPQYSPIMDNDIDAPYAPRDYATKNNSDEEGTLSEDFGFHKKD